MKSVLVGLSIVFLCAGGLLTAMARQYAIELDCPRLRCQSGRCVASAEDTMCLYEYDPVTGNMTCIGSSAC